MKKFMVEKIEIRELEDGIKYIEIFDGDGNNWYDEQQNFQASTLKVMYNKDTLQVLSTSKDISIIAPTMAGDVVEEIEHEDVGVNPALYFVKGKLLELKECETIKNGEIVFDRETKIEHAKRKLRELKEARIRLGVKIKENVYHPVRDTDKINLMAVKGTFSGERDWKYYDKDGVPVIEKISDELIGMIFLKGAKVLDGAILGETKAEEALNTLTDEELQNLDTEGHFEKYYRLSGGI